MKFSRKVREIALKKCVFANGKFYASLTPMEALYLFSIGAQANHNHKYYVEMFEESVKTGSHRIRGTTLVWFSPTGELASLLGHMRLNFNSHGQK